MSVLHDTVAKLKVDSTNTSKPRMRSSLSVVYAPFRSLAGTCVFGVWILAKVSRRHDVLLGPVKDKIRLFFINGHFLRGSVCGTDTAHLLGFNNAAMLISFILSEKWL